MTRIILIASGKGGVGKTTMAANLATALTRLGANVVVVDANFSTGNLGLHFGLDKAECTLHDVLNGRARVDDAVYYHPTGVKFVPMGSKLDDIERLTKKGFSRAILDLVGRVDIIILDGAAGINDELKKAMEIADEVLIITNPEIPALIEALKTCKASEKQGVKPLGVLVNRVRRKKYEVTPQNISEFTELPVVGVVPEDEGFMQALSDKIPFMISKPNSKTAREINRIAARILGKEYLYKNNSLLYRVKKFLGL